MTEANDIFKMSTILGYRILLHIEKPLVPVQRNGPAVLVHEPIDIVSIMFSFRNFIGYDSDIFIHNYSLSNLLYTRNHNFYVYEIVENQ